MLAGMHALTPVIVAGLVDGSRVRRGLPAGFSRRDLAVIGGAGLLPDIADLLVWRSPSWESPVHAPWIAGAALVAILPFLWPRWRPALPTALLAWLAVALHLGLDLVSGGLPGVTLPGRVPGHALVPPEYWVFLDCAAILTTWYVFLTIRFHASRGTLACETCSWEEWILARWRRSYAASQGSPPSSIPTCPTRPDSAVMGSTSSDSVPAGPESHD